MVVDPPPWHDHGLLVASHAISTGIADQHAQWALTANYSKEMLSMSSS
ncbi:MAG: hypothetical protein ACJAQ9_000033 [Ilumatobacter sp.]|jgi:hypothetical protein